MFYFPGECGRRRPGRLVRPGRDDGVSVHQHGLQGV